MAWFNLFSGPSAEKLEQTGDDLSASGFWGAAKLKYEHAYRKLAKASTPDPGPLQRLEGKVTDAKEALAREHHQNAAHLAAIGDFGDALDLVDLAIDLTGDASMQAALADQRRTIEAVQADDSFPVSAEAEVRWDADLEASGELSMDERFMALCGVLPDPVRYTYEAYGLDFQTGYIALNEGDFETAERHLSRALEANPSPTSYIPLELATACLHLGQPQRARQLLETLLKHHPDALPAYQVLCEIHWEQGDYEQAEALLASVPDALAESLAVFMLKGETLFQAGRFNTAIAYYRDSITTYGWNETLARALARAHESIGEADHARRLYQEVMGRCSGCQSRVDPLVKVKYADLSFDAGIHDNAILELYLELARDIPENAATYYAKVSLIYRALGNPAEAHRFSLLADQIAAEAPVLKS